jgi:hypothetical protein
MGLEDIRNGGRKMGKVKPLLAIVREIPMIPPDDEDGPHATIYAQEPWTPSSFAAVIQKTDRFTKPIEVDGEELAYFIEVFIAREFLEDWEKASGVKPDENVHDLDADKRKCEELIHYAIHDA